MSGDGITGEDLELFERSLAPSTGEDITPSRAFIQL